MKKLSFIAVLAVAFFAVQLLSAEPAKYIGTKGCIMCHNTAKSGKQGDIWKSSKHANAFNALAGAQALEIGKAKGIAEPQKAKECLECHTLGKTVAADQLDAKFEMSNGVQCETCHGAGSNYKARVIMTDKAKAVENGLDIYKDDAAIEAQCRSCHNEKSPTFKSFDFKTYYEKIKHLKPKE